MFTEEPRVENFCPINFRCSMDVGDKVVKTRGYEFPGVVVAKFNTTAGELRFVVEMEKYKLLHIFNPDQLTKILPR